MSDDGDEQCPWSPQASMDQIKIQKILCLCACGRTTHRDAFSLNSTAHTQKTWIISGKKKSLQLRLKECKILHGHAPKSSGAQQTMSIKGRIISLKYKEGGEPCILPFNYTIEFRLQKYLSLFLQLYPLYFLTKLHFQNIKKQFQLISNDGTKPEKVILQYCIFNLTNHFISRMI